MHPDGSVLVAEKQNVSRTRLSANADYEYIIPATVLDIFNHHHHHQYHHYRINETKITNTIIFAMVIGYIQIAYHQSAPGLSDQANSGFNINRRTAFETHVVVSFFINLIQVI